MRAEFIGSKGGSTGVCFLADSPWSLDQTIILPKNCVGGNESCIMFRPWKVYAYSSELLLCRLVSAPTIIIAQYLLYLLPR